MKRKMKVKNSRYSNQFIHRLDIGCGKRWCGDVNIDLEVPDNANKIPHFVKADAQHLPFKDKIFQESFSSHVIEHLQHPRKLIEEMLRVTKEIIVIATVHRFGREAKNKGHIQFFTRNWFSQVFRDYDVRFYTTYWYPIPLFGILHLPNYITVEVVIG